MNRERSFSRDGTLENTNTSFRTAGSSAWFDAMEQRETYRGTQSDAHTHSHDLPPQMGGCYASGSSAQRAAARLVDQGPFGGAAGSDGCVPDVGYDDLHPAASALEAVARTVKHRKNLVAANVIDDKVLVDEALRCALTNLLAQVGFEGDGQGNVLEVPTRNRQHPPPLAIPQHMSRSNAEGAPYGIALRYIRDRVNVPRDMGLWPARRMREALEATAALAVTPGNGQEGQQGPPIPTNHRRDQNPLAFRR